MLSPESSSSRTTACLAPCRMECFWLGFCTRDRTASTHALFPTLLGPVITVTPGARSMRVARCDIKFSRVMLLIMGLAARDKILPHHTPGTLP